MIVGFPLNITGLKVIKAGFYAMWLIVTTKAASKYFAESTKHNKGT